MEGKVYIEVKKESGEIICIIDFGGESSANTYLDKCFRDGQINFKDNRNGEKKVGDFVNFIQAELLVLLRLL